MIDRQICAQLALHVYEASELNLPIVRPPWQKIANQPPGTAGFAYAVYKNQTTKEVVISYRGTDNDAGDWLTNFGVSVGQEVQAAQVYARILREHGSDAQGSNITFTGHSLGGGIAATMSVWFNRPAVVFDPAPSERFAKEPIQVANVIDQLGNDAPQAIVDYFANISPQFATREGNVTSYYVPGSPVRATSTAGNTITGFAQDYPLTFGSAHMVGSYEGLKNLHSQALHTAGVMLPAFRSATVAVQSALPLVMSKELYAEPASGSPRNFLIDLIRSEQANAGNGKLSHFAADLSLLGPVVPTLSPTAQDALIAQCIEWYYRQPENYTGPQFYTVSGNTLRYSTAQGIQSKAAAFVDKWLTPVATDHGMTSFPSFGTAYQQWNVATGTGHSIANAIDASKTQLFVGQGGNDDYQGGTADDLFFAGAGADLIKGGAGDDRLYGGAGNDTLTGGAGDDQLFGGAGTDTYSFAGSFGADTITDTGADGTISVAGLNTINGAGAFKTSGSTWQSHDGQVVYALADSGTGKTDLVIAVSSAGATGRVVVRDWVDGRLGISLGTTPMPQPIDQGYTGDYLKSQSNGHYVFDPVTHNVASAGAQANAPDWLVGSFADDQIQGLGGNDLLVGWEGDDLVQGGDGADLLYGGLGRDTLEGGSGNDFIWGSGWGGYWDYMQDMVNNRPAPGNLPGTPVFKGAARKAIAANEQLRVAA